MKDPSSQNSTSPNSKLGYRIGRGLRSAGDAVANPCELPGKARGWFRRWFGKVWSVRGGGLYACGYALTFIWFEVATLADEVAESSGVGDFVKSQVVEFIPRFALESLANMIKAFMWPVYVVQINPPYGAIALGAAFVAFPVFLKKPIERWLFGEDLNPGDR